MAILINVAAAEAQELPTRSQIADKYKWNLADFYTSDEAFEKDFNTLKADLDKYKTFSGKLNTAAGLANCINFYMNDSKIYMKLYVYAECANDIDVSNTKNASQFDRVSKIGSEFATASAFINPEILALPEGKVASFIKSNKTLQEYAHYFDQILRLKKHTLSTPEEKITSAYSPMDDLPSQLYSVLNDSELPFGTTTDENGKEVRISHGRYRSALYSTDREYRKRVYLGTYKAYDQLINTFATIYNGTLTQRIINSKLRNYSGVVESCLYPYNIPVSVYENLIRTCHDNFSSLHRWASIKKKYLKLDELHPYDTYATFFPELEKSYTFEEGKELVLKALAPLGEEYINTLKKTFDSRWIDVYETKGKHSGAYSNNCNCGVHPIVLLNWNNTLDDVFTLAHELGHNMHSYFTEKTQPYQYRDYANFIAEVASTTNEALLLDYLIDNAKTDAERGYLYEKFLVNAQTTFFRQARFGEFEKITNENAEKGKYMNSEELTKLFGDLYQQYWGNDMVTDREEGLSWARIPHFYSYNLYVYQYATSFCCAQAFAQLIKTQGQPAIDKYMKNFLCAGSSQYPIDVLKNAGVNISTPAPINAMIQKFNTYLDDLEKILQKRQ